MNILTWNCRGAGSDVFFRNLLDMLQQYKPAMLILLETRVPSSRGERILTHSYFDRFLPVEARGFAGGIWMFWEESRLDVELLSMNEQILNVAVKNGNKVGWVLSAVYASPKPICREGLWVWKG